MGDNDQSLVITLAICFATLSLLASLLTLELIRKLKKWNGYMQLVVSLTACQIIYDIGFYPLAWFGYIEGQIAYIVLNTWGGLTSTLWSNVIILVTARIVVELRTIDIMKKYKKYCVAVYVPSTIVALLSAVMLGDVYVTLVYFAMRSFSIMVNVFAICIIFFKIGRMRKDGDMYTASPKSNPVFVLSMRLVYYCAVQTITRIGNSWYQLQYGFGKGYDASEASVLQTVLYFSEFILTPSAGIGYLIVFLCIQPDAYYELRKMCCFCYCCSEDSTAKKRRKQLMHKGAAAHRVSACDETADAASSVGVSSARGEREGGGTLGEALIPHPHNDGEYDEEGSDAELRPSSCSSGSSGVYRDSSRESMFPLLEMDEDDLAREIDRIYAYTNIVPPGSASNIGDSYNSYTSKS